MHWASWGRGPWPQVPFPGPVDEAAARLVLLTFPLRPEVQRAVFTRYGIGPLAGSPPGRGEGTRSRGESLRQVLAAAARAGGPPPALVEALRVVEGALPATPGRMALMLYDHGLTTGVLHPLTISALAVLWGLSRPRWTWASRAGGLPLLVSPERPRPPGLDEVARALSVAALQPIDAAVSLLGAVPHGANPLDLLVAWGLTVDGSPVAWDRARTGRLLRPVRKTLAAWGALPVGDVLAGLHRGRHESDAPRPVPEDPALLLAWASEHRQLTVHGDEIGLPDPDPERWLSPTDRIMITLLRERDLPMRSATMAQRLLDAGAVRTFAPYLTSAGRGLVRLRGARPG